jgi:hypothetical protein
MPQTNDPLQAAFDYYLAHQAELVEMYEGRVIVIKDNKVLGAYDDDASAVFETQRHHELGTFLVQRVSGGNSAYSQTFHSRVAFA